MVCYHSVETKRDQPPVSRRPRLLDSSGQNGKVENRDAWNSTARFCPGIGKGPLIQIGDAMEIAEQQRCAYPNDY